MQVGCWPALFKRWKHPKHVVPFAVPRRNGWYPAVLGPGNVAAKGRVPFALLALMDALRMFPGQVPPRAAAHPAG